MNHTAVEDHPRCHEKEIILNEAKHCRIPMFKTINYTKYGDAIQIIYAWKLFKCNSGYWNSV